MLVCRYLGLKVHRFQPFSPRLYLLILKVQSICAMQYPNLSSSSFSGGAGDYKFSPGTVVCRMKKMASWSSGSFSECSAMSTHKICKNITLCLPGLLVSWARMRRTYVSPAWFNFKEIPKDVFEEAKLVLPFTVLILKRLHVCHSWTFAMLMQSHQKVATTLQSGSHPNKFLLSHSIYHVSPKQFAQRISTQLGNNEKGKKKRKIFPSGI